MCFLLILIHWRRKMLTEVLKAVIYESFYWIKSWETIRTLWNVTFSAWHLIYPINFQLLMLKLLCCINKRTPKKKTNKTSTKQNGTAGRGNTDWYSSYFNFFTCFSQLFFPYILFCSHMKHKSSYNTFPSTL